MLDEQETQDSLGFRRVLRLDLAFLDVCLEQDSDFDEDTFIDKFCGSDIHNAMDMGWVNVPNEDEKSSEAVVFNGDVPYDSYIRYRSEMFDTPIVTFKNLKMLKSFIQKKGTIPEKEGILIMIKKFKDGSL